MEMEREAVVGFLVGLGIGIGVGVLFAPETGEQTRARIRDEAGKGADYLKQHAAELKDSAAKSYQTVKDEAGRLKERVAARAAAGEPPLTEGQGI